MRLPFVAFLAVLAFTARADAKDKRQVTGPICVKQDIVYMIDSSTYIGVENFQQQLDFIKNNIRYYNINPACTRVGIVTYSSGAYNQFYLNSYTNQQQLLNAIDNIKYHPGGRNTGDVINFVSSYGFSSSNGGRQNVPHYGILVTGSTSSNPQLTLQAARNAQGQGITLFTVGVGNGVSGSELSGITGNVDKNTFYSTGYNSLNTISAPLATRINGAVSPQLGSNLGTPAACLQQADIVFMVDGSGSIGRQNFMKMENFLKGLVGKLDVRPNNVHVGLMQFSSRPQREFPLNMYTNRQDAMTGVDQMHYMGGGTNTADAIRMLREQMFSTSHGARPNVPRIGVIITDGKSANSVATATQANNARQDNIGLIAIGVGSGVDVNELHSIADDPDSANSFTVSNFDQLDNIATQIIQRACSVRATAPPPTAKTIQGPSQPDPCQDKISDCASYAKSVCSGDYFGWAKDNCPRYCGFCLPMYTTAPPPCVDKLNNCNEYQANSCVGGFTSWAKDNCRKYCGYCDATAQSVGFYGNCYYKGKTYSEGEKWDDGCDYSCTCLDGTTGNYQCYNKCPVYYNLPSECTLVKSDTQCCLQPVCDFKPQISTTETTSPGKTPDGVDVCVFKNRQYYQGQTWEDGCQFSCTCTNARIGIYKCQTLCPRYTSLPSYCHMETKAGECCQKPVCEFQTQTGSFTGSGTISGHGTGISPTAPPACVDVIPDCNRYGTQACVDFKPWARDNCRKTCQLCVDNSPSPDPSDVCIYNGRAFHQGDSWQVGCDTKCTCENAVYGYYRCVNTCPKYNNIPSQCREEKKAGECCTKIVCSSGTFISSTGNLGTVGNGGLIQVGPNGAVPTIPSGGMPAPGTGGTVFRPPSLKGCLYKGQVYIQGQRWEDGCQYACECTNANTGVYQCTAKCPTFPNLPSECHLEVDPNDQCCQKPKCTFTGTPQPVVPVFPPSTSGQSVVEPPKPGDLYQGTQTVISIFTGPGSVGNVPTADPNIHGGIGHCEYKGRIYQQAETWQDGCQYNCVCEDSTRGFYRCLDRCQTYPPLPKPCVLVQDPADSCCKKPSCTFTGVQTVIVGQSNVTTPYPIIQQPTNPPVTAPAQKMCVYKNHQYSQGQSWYDGCDYRCSCDNAESGYYRCQRRCPEFFNVPSNCQYVPDPNDPSCCRAPQCTPTPRPGQTLAPGAIPTIAPGTFVGAPNATGYVGYCEYNGQLYRQGDTWQDKCDYTCTCEDAAKGRYKCIDRCPSYGALPPQCQMVADFTNPCCKKPECNFNGNIGQITGTLTPAPAPGFTLSPQPGGNQAPAPKYCVYKTASYSQGQTWNDGCQFRCRCDDSSRGLYTCNERCPRYENIPPQCTMVTDPNDSCCRQPKCDFTPTTGQITGTAAPNPNIGPNPNPTSAPRPNPIPTKVPAVIVGQANTPAPTPGPNGQYPSPQPLNFCVYKGAQYSQGQRWDDGCDFECVCEDASTAKYRCVEKCTKYTNIPAQCTLMKDAAKPCCFKPVCNFNPSTGQITGQLTTKAPQPGQPITPAPYPGQPNPYPNPGNPNPYPSPGLPKDVCVYRTDQYTQGQQWFDGCNFKCTCEDAQNGIYRCSERCTKYPSLPAGCTLVADPSDPLCCKIPQCAPNPNRNSSQPYPTPPPGHVTGGSVTPAPTPINTPAPQPGVSTQRPPVNPTPAPTPVCVYKGKTYTQGQRWQDGCDYNCVCLNADMGRYDCTEICPRYPNLPAPCILVQDINQPCCKKPVCNFQGTTNGVTGTLAPIPGGATLAPSPGYNPTPGPSGPTQAPTPKNYCMYNGVVFRQGQRWDDGCDLRCVCENEMTGYYRCNQRCAKYPQVPAGCTLETDPNDPCCRKPVCRSLPTPAPNPYNIPRPNPSGSSPTLAPGFTPAPGQTFAPYPNPNQNPTPGPGQTPSPNPTPYIPTLAPPLINGQGVTPTPKPGVTTLKPPIPVCVYNGKSYTQGQTWQDGCQFNCVCVDASTGQYQCSQRCPVYPSIPSYCRMVTSQSDPCCKEPQCSQQPTPQPNPYSTPNPAPSGSTIRPPLNPASTIVPNPQISPFPSPQPRQYCVMNGRQYTQGQQWNDGCDRICVCDDQTTGHYKCSDRCKQYTQIPSGCTMVPDPSDPLCCQVPNCIPIPGTNGNPTPGPTDGPTMYTNAPHAVVTGMATPTPSSRVTPAPVPGQTTPRPTPAPKVCVYKGKTYAQGQRWQDGCDFDCICEDGMTGKYKCTARCGTYPNLPRQCQLQRDPNDYCCYVPVCNWNSNPTPRPNPFSTPRPNITPRPGQPTPAPLPGQTVAPSPGPGQSQAPTPLPQPKTVCVYNGVTFAQGQIINDGCTQRCRCDDADTNYYNCFDRCADYPNLPSNCYMVTDPKDSCCQIPKCTVVPTPAPNPYLTPAPGQTYPPGMIPTPAPGQTYPPGLYPMPGPGQTFAPGILPTPAPGQTYAPGIIPTPAPGQTYAPGIIPTPAPGQTYAPGLYPSYPYPSPSPLPTAVPGQIINKPDPTRPPSQRGFCVYQGVKYRKGQTWDDGCNYKCECLDDMTGQYRCLERCARYPSIPAYCIMVQDPNDQCCKKPSCPGLQPTPAPNMTPAPFPGPGQTYAPGMIPIPAPGQTYPPGMVPTPGPGQTYAPGIVPTPAPGQTYAPGIVPTPGPGQTYAPGLVPTPAPGQTYAPGKIPTPGPGQTYAPGLFPTPGPNQTPSPNPTPIPQPVPKDVCVMNGKSYTQGQQWYDGCRQICVCDDGVTGHYTCNQRCSVYRNIPSTCVYVPDPNDPICCQIPQCKTSNSTIPQPVTGSHTGGGPQPTPRPNPYLIPRPGQSTIAPYLTPGPGQTPAPGQTFAPNPNAQTTPAPPKVCVYKGNTYTQGQSWRDGCLYDCTCDDAMNGKYRCNDICPKYPGLPPYCTMVYDPLNPCCKKPQCATVAPQPLGSTPSPAPGVVPVPQPNPTPATNFCVYNGVPLPKGQVFYDGCDRVCRCEDPVMNDLVCDERCPTYPPLRGGCTMVTDPQDSCCQVPQCAPTNPGTSPNTTVITGVPGTINGQNQPKPNPGTGPVVGTRDVCLYHGTMYKTGDKWDDGCTYTCVCVDGKTGAYRCTEKCPRYPKVPAQCSMVKDPNNPCCEVPRCSYIPPIPAPNSTPAPQPGVTQYPPVNPTLSPNPNPGVTPVPQPGTPAQTPSPRSVCQYKNQYYRQDQIWYDDCNAICRCDNAATGYYSCQERCAKYPSVPPRCTLVPDPKDPTCCKVASCPLTPTGPAPTPGFLQPNPNTPAPPQVTGIAPVPTPSGPYRTPSPQNTPAPQPGVVPNPNVSPTPAPQAKTGCYYRGVVYSKGQTWQDGCDYNCVCIDDMTGQYSCTKRCQDYPTVPTQCVLIQDPNDACCKKPYCDFINPRPFPNGIPTPAPNPNQTPVPGTQTTPAPFINPTPAPPGYCVYKGTYYTQGQTWTDGCDKTCRCDDVSTGYYACTNRCPVYNNYPSNCKLVTDPNDNCCLIPDCNTFSVPQGPGVGPSGTNNPFNPGTQPGVTGINPNTTPGSMIVVPTYIPGTFTGSSNNNPNGNPQTGPTGRNNFCVYKGAIHRQGDTWDDGCSYQCTCVDESRGLYSCTERCPRYVNLPPYCTYKTDPRDRCCKVASCDLSQIPSPGPPTPSPRPTIPGVYSPGVVTGPSGSNQPFPFQPGTGPAGSGTNPPFTFQPNPGPGISGSNPPVTQQPGTGITGSRDKCVYKDMSQHPKGTTWQDGCDYTCVCEDPTTNQYKCNARCPSFSDLPSSCYLVTDPSDSCCKVPGCSGTLSPITGTGVQPTRPGTNIVPVGTHATFSGSGRPTNIPGLTASGARSVCVYKGSVHKQGQSWDDGCQYTCTCTDANRGLYSCTSKCPAFPSNIPTYCKLNTVPGMCCKSLTCNIPNLGNYNPAPQLIPTPAPTSSPGATPTPSSGNPPLVIYPSGTQPMIGNNQFPGSGYGVPPGTQVTDIRNQCVYKNRIYNQGETWDDGCEFQCECKDAKTGFYECKPLCPIYQNLPQGCYTVKAAGQCCEQPVCQKPDGSTFNPVTNPTTGYPVYGTFQPGVGGFRPGYNPSTGITGNQVVSGQANRCIYNGRIYSQGQTWDDACKFSCQCTDAQHGVYTCSPQCPTYTTLPSACRMVTFPGQCCQEPLCSSQPAATFPSPILTAAPHVGGCYDAISNCNAYGKTSCVAPYVEWAKQNCNAYCGFCTSSVTQGPQQCSDKKSDCSAYGPNACTGQFEPWARDNCAKTCNLCSTTPASVVTIAPQPTTTACTDKISNCVDYGQSGCEAPYEAWAYDNCRKTCNLCNSRFNTPNSITGGLPSTNNWMIMLKGVAGAPGPDLYSLWNSPNTLNAQVPEAMYLTSQYNGHYKPDLSNYWNSLCIDKVKVAIYNNGIERANIIFDASGANKNNWFDPSRIISSTYTDIKYAPKNLFSMIGDQLNGHEFAMTSSGSGCNVQGWMFISTRSNCNFERGANKPAFYYALGQTATNFGSASSTGSGDVFAILAHPNCQGIGPTIPSLTITATSNFCIYKNKIYRQGETWTDGCQYNCTCEDGQTGFYRCLNLCPVWNNLPAACTLQKPPGECCDKPVCNGINFGQNNLTSTCFYNGNYYQEGQEWKDGCKYKCSCEDGKTGFYKCSTLCLQWNLPPSCHMDPAPAGYCCQVPNCPSNIAIQYPPNYVQQ